jgi:hypothetical protein
MLAHQVSIPVDLAVVVATKVGKETKTQHMPPSKSASALPGKGALTKVGSPAGTSSTNLSSGYWESRMI